MLSKFKVDLFETIRFRHCVDIFLTLQRSLGDRAPIYWLNVALSMRIFLESVGFLIFTLSRKRDHHTPLLPKALDLY